jgi:hypothetical protein
MLFLLPQSHDGVVFAGFDDFIQWSIRSSHGNLKTVGTSLCKIFVLRGKIF